jgi:methyl-accepting chemotaxis protein
VKLKYKLFSGYLAIIVLAMILCLWGLNSYRTVHTHFVTTTQDILPGQQAMMHAKQAALAMIVKSQDYLRTSDEIHVQFAHENIDDLREALRTHLEHEAHVGEAEKGVAEEMERRGLRLIDLCNDLIEVYQRGDSKEILSQGREKIRLGKDELFEILDEHLAVHEQELLNAQDAIYRTIVNGFWTFLAASVLILAWGVAVALYSAKTIVEPIHELERGAGIIGGGDLDHRLDIQTGDEIEQLAAAFNGMADRRAHPRPARVGGTVPCYLRDGSGLYLYQRSRSKIHSG